jgi:excisionase family DNA binding protein
MVIAVVGREPVSPREHEANDIRKVEAIIRRLDTDVKERVPITRLVAGNGEEVQLPEAAYQVLKQAIHLLAQGQAVAIVPYNKMLTTQQAAELLNVSRPHLIKLLNSDRIPFHMVGTHRRVRFDDLMKYRGRRDQDRRRKLDEITKLSQRLGLYEKP